ncbi:MAG: universal stress protein [Haloferacaceae archaeon]
MNVLVAVDGSDCSRRALEFACGFVTRFDAELSVVHVSDRRTEATDAILEWARETLAEAGVDAEAELSLRDISIRPASKAGEAILDLVDEEGYDHVVMGHHGDGVVEEAMLGSATETVISDASVGVTIVP